MNIYRVHVYRVNRMALLRYFKPLQTTDSFPDCKSCPSLSEKELKLANQMSLNIWPSA